MKFKKTEENKISIKHKIFPLLEIKDYTISELAKITNSQTNTISMACSVLEREGKIIKVRQKLSNSGKARFQTLITTPNRFEKLEHQIDVQNIDVQNGVVSTFGKNQKILNSFEYYIDKIKERKTYSAIKLTQKITKGSKRNKHYTLNILQDFFNEIKDIETN